MLKNKNRPINVFWFRRDLRLEDNLGLHEAMREDLEVLPIFIFDTTILNELPDKSDARVAFIYKIVAKLKSDLKQLSSDLYVMHGDPLTCMEQLISEFEVNALHANEDYEPYGRRRDEQVRLLAQGNCIAFKTYKDQVMLGPNEVLKKDGKPYTVFTPYYKKWLLALNLDALSFNRHKWIAGVEFIMPKLKDIGFNEVESPNVCVDLERLNFETYHEFRDYPARNKTSKLGLYLRFGIISIRDAVRKAQVQNGVFLKELCWREFFMMIMFHFPESRVKAFKPKYERIQWRNQESEFKAWCNGETGYPLVDAGMRELNATGYMHNRVRMVVASFLCKHLLIDWRWGEAYFASKLLDYELSSNVGNWQWASGSGCDAVPYFRVFNPELQQQKFDADFEYILSWIPEVATDSYPSKIVEHKVARARAINTYKYALVS